MLRLADSWIWDSWFVFDGQNHHVFYLRASRALGDPHRRHRHPYIGHAISKDLKNWTVLQDAIAISDPPAFDSWTTWTGSVVKGDDGLWWMYYTGTSRQDGGDIQRVGAATSKDLLTWEKVSSEALVEADAAHYELLDYDKWHDQAWRDPWVFKHSDGNWHMFITARTNNESFDTRDRGTLGHAISDDMTNWKVQPPLISEPSGFGQLEVFQVEQIDGKAVLLWCCGPDEISASSKEKFGGRGGMFSVIGESVFGPFDPRKAVRFDHESIYAARIVKHEGVWQMIGFRDHEDGKFIGELTDPIPVKIEGNGLVPA
jgi:beta-fructofuranosidase